MLGQAHVFHYYWFLLLALVSVLVCERVCHVDTAAASV